MLFSCEIGEKAQKNNKPKKTKPKSNQTKKPQEQQQNTQTKQQKNPNKTNHKKAQPNPYLFFLFYAIESLSLKFIESSGYPSTAKVGTSNHVPKPCHSYLGSNPVPVCSFHTCDKF